MKIATLLILICGCCIFANAQEKIERLETAWPAQYKWKIVSQRDDSSQMNTFIIPGNESVNSATILGAIRVMKGFKLAKSEEILNYYRNHIDSGSVLTVVEQLESDSHPWVLFKVETPATRKYDVAESDLYFVIQGDFGLYENYVAIKEAFLTRDFVAKWSKVLKSSKLILQ